MRKTKILIYSVLISAISFSEIIDVKDRNSFESAIVRANKNDTIRLSNDITILNDYTSTRSNAVNTYDNYNIANGVTIDGGNYKLEILGRNLSLNGDTTFKNLNLVLVLPDSTNDNKLKEIGNSAIIYANENNLTLDNVKFSPDGSSKYSIAPTIVMGNEISKESSNDKVENTLTILNTSNELRLKTIVAGSENKSKESKSIIKIPENVKLDMEGGTILLENIGNVSNNNLNVLVENKSRGVRTFKTSDDSNINIVLENVKYGFIKDKKIKFNGEIDNLTLKGSTEVEILDETRVGTLNLEENNEKKAPTVKVDKQSSDDNQWGDDDYDLPNGENGYNGSLTVTKIVSKTDNAVIDLLNSASASVTTVEGNFKLKDEDRNNFIGLPSDKGNPTVKDDKVGASGDANSSAISDTSTNTADTEPKNNNEDDVQPPSPELPKEKEVSEESMAPPDEDTPQNSPVDSNNGTTSGDSLGKADEDNGMTGDLGVTNDNSDASKPSISTEKDPKDDNGSSDVNGETIGIENGKDTALEEQPATDASSIVDTKPDNGDQANLNEVGDGLQDGGEEKPKENDVDIVSGGGTIDNPTIGSAGSGESSEPNSSDKPSVNDGNTASTTPNGEQPTVTDNTAETSDTSVDKPDEEAAVQPPVEEKSNTDVENTSTGETSTNGGTPTTDPVVTPPEAPRDKQPTVDETDKEDLVGNGSPSIPTDAVSTEEGVTTGTTNKQNEDDKQNSPTAVSDKVEEDEKNSNGEVPAENLVVKEKKELPHTRTILNGNSSRVLSSVMNENYYILENNLRNGLWGSTSANVGRLGRDYKIENSGIFLGYNKEMNSNNYAIGFSYNNLGMKDKKDKLNSEMYAIYAHTDFKLDNNIFGITTSLGINKSKLKDDILFGNKLMYGYEFNFKNIKIVPMIELRHLMVKEKSYELPEMKAKVDAKTVNYFNNMIGTKLSYTKDNLKLFTQIGVDINLKNKSEVRTLTVDGVPHINVNEKLDRVTNEFILGAEYEMIKNLVLGLQYKSRYNSKKSSNDLKFFIKYTF